MTLPVEVSIGIKAYEVLLDAMDRAPLSNRDRPGWRYAIEFIQSKIEELEDSLTEPTEAERELERHG